LNTNDYCSHVLMIFFFFFSSRRRHTRCLSDWSSDVCSSDLADFAAALGREISSNDKAKLDEYFTSVREVEKRIDGMRKNKDKARSEERRVGKECRSRMGREEERKKRER